MIEANRTGIVSVATLTGWILLCFAASLSGILFPPGDWYAGLHKPSWNPPGWIFGPVWTLLYILMAVSAWSVWRRGGWASQRGPLTCFLIQLGFNALWTPLFFGIHQPLIAFACILLLWGAILMTIRSFMRVHKTAAYLLVPYLLWVSFASVLNFTLWRLNR